MVSKVLVVFVASLCALVQADVSSLGYSRDAPASNRLTYDTNLPSYQGYEESTGLEIPGEAGKDYPVFREVPQTGFECGQQQFPGYYADVEAACQAFHICQASGQKDSFLCPNGTLFNQERLVCEWWNVVDCSQARSFYSVNEAIVRAMEDSARAAAEKNSAGGYRYQTPSTLNLQPSGSFLKNQNQNQVPSNAGPASALNREALYAPPKALYGAPEAPAASYRPTTSTAFAQRTASAPNALYAAPAVKSSAAFAQRTQQQSITLNPSSSFKAPASPERLYAAPEVQSARYQVTSANFGKSNTEYGVPEPGRQYIPAH